MYRRRQNRSVQMNNEQQQQQQNKVEDKPQVEAQTIQEYHEPVIKATVSHVPPKKLVDTPINYCPMVNTLRAIDYFGKTGVKSVSFEDMVDVLFSEGYLNVSKDTYDHYFVADSTMPSGYKPKEGDAISQNWNGLYTTTSNYDRDTFVAGDIIFGRSQNITVAFLISKVYKGSSTNGTSSVLDYNPPVGGDKKIEQKEDSIRLSTFSDVEGNVYSFALDVQLNDLLNGKYTLNGVEKTNLVSVDIQTQKPVILVPTNQSKDAENTSAPQGRTATQIATSAEYPLADLFPEEKTGEISNRYNLTTGVNVEGWLIYMYYTGSETGESESKLDPSKIVSDVIKTGPITISTIGAELLELGGVFKYPFKGPSTSPQEIVKFEHTGNNTRFASEPLNSQQYQANFGEIQSINELDFIESNIHTLKCFTVAPTNA